MKRNLLAKGLVSAFFFGVAAAGLIMLLSGCSTVTVPTAGKHVDVVVTGVGAQLAASTAPGTPGVMVGMFKIHVRTSPVSTNEMHIARSFGATTMQNTSWNPFNTSFDDYYGDGDVAVSVTNGAAVVPKSMMSLAPMRK